MATIADVAQRAGVSISTVSHVVNRTRFVAPETTRRVLEAIDVIGYTPNTLARSLKRATTSSVGLAMSAISNPYFADLICAIEKECARLGLMVFLSDTEDDPAREVEIVRAFHARRVDGIVLAPSADPAAALAQVTERKIPCVLVDRLPDPGFDQVGIDNEAAVEALVGHLLAHGHRRIGYVAGQPGLATTLARVGAFRAVLAAAGVAVADGLVEAGCGSTDEAAAAMARLLDRAERPTAVIAGNNLATIGAMRALGARGLAVPRDVSLVGIDDFEWAECFEPRLTLIAQPCAEIGRAAAALLVERIADPDGPRRTLRLVPRLSVRELVGTLA